MNNYIIVGLAEAMKRYNVPKPDFIAGYDCYPSCDTSDLRNSSIPNPNDYRINASALSGIDFGHIPLYRTGYISENESIFFNLLNITKANRTIYIGEVNILGAGNNTNNITLYSFNETDVVVILPPSKPELVVGDWSISFAPNESIKVGDNISIDATIFNFGTKNATNVEVRFYDGNPSLGGRLIGTTLINVSPLWFNKTTITKIASARGHNIYIVVDPDNVIDEINESNNVATVIIGSLPDLTIANLTPSKTNPLVNETIVFTVVTKNIGNAPTENLSYIYYYQGDTHIGNITVDILDVNSSQTNNFTWTCPSILGIYTIRAVADATNVLNERNEANNEINFTITCHRICLCSSCSECTKKLNDPSCSIITLNVNITNFAGDCINNPINFTNKIFDCQGFTIDGNGTGYGIYLDRKINNIIRNCIITDFENGIYLSYSSNNVLINNTMNNNTFNFNIYGEEISHYYQDIDTSNKVNGKLIYYWTNKNNAQNNCKNLEINESSNAGFVALVSCENITIKNLYLTKNSYGILLVNTSNSKILNNTAIIIYSIQNLHMKILETLKSKE